MIASLRIFALAGLASLLVVNASMAARAETTESERLDAFFERLHQAALKRWPEWQTSLGIKDDYGLWNDRSEAKAIAEHEITIRNLTELRRQFDFDQLDADARLNYRLFERGAEISIAFFPFRHHGYPIDQMGGLHKRIPSFLINRHAVDSLADAEAYVARLKGVGALMDQVIQQLEIRSGKGIVPPRFVFPKVLDDITQVVTGAPFDGSDEDSTILADFREKLGTLALPAPEHARLLDEAERALREMVAPAYGRLARSLAALQKQATTDDGVWKFPDGPAYYALALRSTTTTDLSPQEIHDYGLSEVARIHDEMRGVAAAIGFQGSLPAFFDFMRTDPDNFYPNSDAGRAAYLADTTRVIDEMRQSLGEFFIAPPKARLVVKRVEPFREKNATFGFYEAPAIYGDRPGIYYVNLHDMSLLPRSLMEGLAFHEAIPGHHMQIAIARELEGLPKFRRFGGYTAYSEGWALYAERLAKEMGFYRDPRSEFGRLSWELLRAARLVVDTGLHFKRWTREEAIAYLDANLPNSHDANVKSIGRYIVWPAQATAYKIGMRKLLELRARARQRLGQRFDIRAFHQVVLTNGALPLDVLEELVEAWIESES